MGHYGVASTACLKKLGGVAYIKTKLFGVIKVGKKLPTEGNTRCLDAKCGDNVFNLRGRSDGEDIKEKKEGKNRDEEDTITKEKNNEGYEKGKGHIKPQYVLTPFFIGT